MAKVIDISSKLTVEEKFLHVAEGKDYKIDDRKNTVIKINQMMAEGQNSNDISMIDKVISICLGEKAFKEIDKMNLPFAQYQNIFIGIMAAISDKSFDEMEKSFRDSI